MDQPLCSPAATAQEDPWHDARSSVFRLDADHGNATAWLVDDHTVVTNAHVASGHRQFVLVGQDGKRYRAGGDVWVDEPHDLALITLAPGTTIPGARPLPLGDPKSVKPGDELHSFGFPRTFFPQTRAHELPGKVQSVCKMIDQLQDQAKQAGDTKAIKAFREIAANDAARFDPRTKGLFRHIVIIQNGTGPGTSGGPDLDVRGNVVSVISHGVDLEKGTEGSTSVRHVKELLANRESYPHFSGRYENGFQTASHEPLRTLALAIPETGATLAGLNFLRNYRGASALSEVSTLSKTGGIAGAALLGYQTYADANNFISSTNSRDTLKYGIASGGDACMILGVAGMLVPRLGTAGKILFGAGLLGRLSAELIPNNYATDVSQFKPW